MSDAPTAPDDLAGLAEASRAVWDANAEVWDTAMAEGRGYQKILIEPAFERLLDLRPRSLVLDVGCGNGRFSRRLAELGAQVTAVDFSGRLIELAKARTAENAERIDYRQVDATDAAQLIALGEGRFDAAVSSQVLMDIPTVEPLARALPKLLKPGGRFLFSVLHPAFTNTHTVLSIEEEDREGEVVLTRAVKIRKYLGLSRDRGKALYEQPVLQDYYDRPLHALLRPFFEAGFVLDGAEEPAYPMPDAGKPLSWGNFTELPPLLIARMLLPGDTTDVTEARAPSYYISPIADVEALNQENHDIWEANAEFWDDRMGEGNLFNNVLVWPASQQLLAIKPGEMVLDIACGNGVSSRKLADLGAEVVACDYSETFIERARARSAGTARRIDYRVVDATDQEQLLALGERRFDAAVCNMALMDIVTIDPVLAALGRLIKPGGRFVFSIPHPWFNSASTVKMIEREEREGELITTYSLKVREYLTPFTRKLLGMPGQPAFAYWFHRPLGLLTDSFVRAGFVFDGLEEPGWGDTEAPRPMTWVDFKEIPPVLVVRVRLQP